MDTVQMLNLILIVILILILILGFIATLLVYKMRKKREPQASNEINIKSQSQNSERANLITRDGKSIDSIYKFMEFDEVLDNMIVRKGRKQYVMVIECKGINYDLLSEDEKMQLKQDLLNF